MKNLIATAIIASTLLTGCAKHTAIPVDRSPMELNKDSSFAMQVLKSGYSYVPFDIDDAEVSQDAYQNKVSYGTSAALGFLSQGGIGALSGLGLAAIINSGSNPSKGFIQYIAWVPADNIDINDKAAIDDYVKKNYFKPAVEAFMASDAAKNQPYPVEYLGYANGTFKMKGQACAVKIMSYMKKSPMYEKECAMFITGNTLPIRYASSQVGLPFEPSIKANRYIVVRIADTSLTSAGILPFLQTDMMYAYIPGPSASQGAILDGVNSLAPNTMVRYTPYVLGQGQKAYPFVKVKKD